MPWTSSQWRRHSLMPTTDARTFSVLFSGHTVTAGRIISHLLFVLRTAVARLNLQCTSFRCVLVCAFRMIPALCVSLCENVPRSSN